MMSAIVFPLAALLLLVCALALYVAFSSRHRKASLRPLAPVGREGLVERDLAPEGFVIVDGELWRARLCDAGHLKRGQGRIRVVGASGCVLLVEPVS